MYVEDDLLTPVSGIAPLVGQGFRMREIAALLALRRRTEQPSLRPCRHHPQIRARHSSCCPVLREARRTWVRF